MGEHTVSTTTYTCDRCGASQQEPFRSKGKVRIQHDLHDWQGAAVAGFDKSLDLCDPCLQQVLDAALTAAEPPGRSETSAGAGGGDGG